MGVIYTHRTCEYTTPKRSSQLLSWSNQWNVKFALLLGLFYFFQPALQANNVIHYVDGMIFIDAYDQVVCENVTNGGEIEADEFGCPNPTWDPSIITSLSLPTGGTGTLEYIWIMTTDDPMSPGAFWNPIPGAVNEFYDPDPITETTYYRRCARRSGCTDYIGESNIISKEAICCDNITDGGMIAADQSLCFPNTTPAALTNTVFPSGGNNQPIEYQWVTSQVNTPYSPTNPDWTFIPGANSPGYDPGASTGTTYYIRLSRRHGCLDYAGISNTVTISVSDEIIVTIDGLTASCVGANDGSVMVTNISGGQGTYTYSWVGFPGVTDATLTGLGEGTYEVVVTDNNSCTATASFTLAAGVPLTINMSSTDISCMGLSDGTATVDAVPNGSGPFSYLWNDANAQTTATATSLTIGTYSVTVTDDTGCTGEGSIDVNDAVPMTLTLTSTGTACTDSNDGTASVQVDGGVNPFSYLWNDANAQTTATAFDLSPGIYEVTVSDDNGCTATSSVTVDAPMPTVLSFTTSDISCFGIDNGGLTVAVVNGDINDYSILWSNGMTTAGISNLGPGNYGVTVTDVNGCTADGAADLQGPDALILSSTTDSASCFSSSDGMAEVLVSGGTPFNFGVYNYSWDHDNSLNVSMLDDVTPDTYSVTVEDANGCTESLSLEIGAPDEILINFNTTEVSCNGLSDGGAVAMVSGGTSPYTYQWDAPGGSTDTSVSDLPAGAYSLSVTDANQCLASMIVNIMEPTALTLNFNNVNVVCQDDTDGVAVGVPSGGTPPYNFLWETGQQTQAIFNVGVGSYDVTLTDGNGCETVGSAVIDATTTLSSSTTHFDATCFDVNNGIAIATGINGTSPYTFDWSNGGTTSQIDNLFFGVYEVTVTDQDGCSVINSATVESPPLLDGSIQVTSEVEVFGGTEGSAILSPTGGVPSYSFLWSDGQTTSTVTGLGGGTHIVTITDANACTATAQVTLIEPSKIGNYVWDDANQNGIQDVLETGIEGIEVTLTGVTTPGDSILLTTTTDSTGFYAFDGLTQGFYYLAFDAPANHVVTYQNVGSDLLDSDPDPSTGLTPGFPITQGEYEDRWDCGMIVLDEKLDIGDKVWYDVNHDGLQGLNEAGVEGIVVRLREMPSNAIIAVDVTDLLGNYLFEDVLPGNYTVEFSMASFPPGGYIISPKDEGTDDTKDSDANINTGITDVFTVFPFTLDNLTIDAGIYKECDNVTDGGVIGYDEELCGVGADPSEIVNVISPTGGFGTLEYLWMKSNIPVFNGPGDPNWMIIPNSNSASLDPGPIGLSTYYIRCVRREGCDDYIGESNVVAKEITPFPLVQIIDEPNVLCKNEEGRYEAAIAGAGATYYWEFGGGGNPATASTRVVDPVKWATPGVKTISLTVTRLNCSYTISSNVIIDDCTINPLIVFDNVFAEAESESVRLRWSAIGNTSNTVFFVQTSEDGQNFETIGNVMGQEGLDASHYIYKDYLPRFGENHYRLQYQKLDADNESGYSETSKVMFQRTDDQFAQVFPNPTKGAITIELLEKLTEPAVVEIISSFGKVVATFEIPAETEKYDFDFSGEHDGLYLVKIKQPKLKAQICKVFKSK